MMPEITIIIPHLRQWQQLDACLASLGAQSVSRDRFVVVVVDNGSADFERGRQRLADAYPGITVDSEAKAGPGPARNKGIAAARTELIACIDADCIADSRWVETAIHALKTTGPGTIYGGDVRIALKNTQTPTALEAYESVFGFRQRLYIKKKHFSGTGNLAFWRADFDKVGPFADITVAEDVDWGDRSHRLGLGLIYNPEMIVYHPARSDMAALESKWSRHIAHELALARTHQGLALRWPAKTFAVAVSWIPHLPLIWTSNRLSGIRARFRASEMLVRIRLFRAREMVRQMMTAGNEAQRWNR